jgi:hypothetical protein
MERMTTPNPAHEPSVRPRPPLLRALGKNEPPPHIDIDGRSFQLERIVKHDSWAATAFYISNSQKIVCKFNRQQRIGLLPMRWLGRWLGKREAHALRLLAGLPGIPAVLGEVRLAGKRLTHAVAHEFIPGRPLRRIDHVSRRAFTDLETLLGEVHRRGMAYVDLHKRENILVGDDGRLYLLDFQICFCMRSWWPANALPVRLLLKLLQRSDRYHLGKHYAHCIPDRSPEHVPLMPWWIRWHRRVARPLRSLRRRLLVKIGVRAGRGRVDTEHFAEEGVRL